MSIGLQNPETVLIRAAERHQWVRETKGPNRGEVVDQMIRSTGLDPDHPPAGLTSIPWCAAFVAYLGLTIFGKLWPLKPVAGCMSLRDDAIDKGLLRNVPTKGAIFLLWSTKKNRMHHCGFVTSPVGSGPWGTVEGNTSPDGSPEGTGVFVRERVWSEHDRFIWWWM